MDVIIKPFPSGNYGEQEVERVWESGWMHDSKETMSSPHSKIDAHTNSETVAAPNPRACAGSNQMGTQHWEEKWAWAPNPNQQTICNWYLLAMGKFIFSSGISLRVLITLQVGTTPRSSWPAQNRSHGIFCRLFVTYHTAWSFCLSIFCLFILVSIFVFLWSLCGFSFSSLFFKERGAWNWVDEVVERIWEELGRGKITERK